MELEEIKQRDDMLDAAIKTGDHADLSAIIKRRQNDSLNQSAMRDPYDHASPANIAYMQVQDSVNSGVTALVHPKDDPALKRLMDHISAKYPRGGSVASKIKDRPLQQAEIQQFSGKLIRSGFPLSPPLPLVSSPLPVARAALEDSVQGAFLCRSTGPLQALNDLHASAGTRCGRCHHTEERKEKKQARAALDQRRH